MSGHGLQLGAFLTSNLKSAYSRCEAVLVLLLEPQGGHGTKQEWARGPQGSLCSHLITRQAASFPEVIGNLRVSFLFFFFKVWQKMVLS